VSFQAVALVDAYLERTTGAIPWRGRAATRAVEPNLDSLENRYPSLGGSRVRIPPPPLNKMISREFGPNRSG